MGTIQTPCLSRRRLIIKIVAVILPNVLGRMDQERDVRLAIANIVDFYHWDYISIYGNREQKERLMQNVVIDALKGPRTRILFAALAPAIRWIGPCGVLFQTGLLLGTYYVGLE